MNPGNFYRQWFHNTISRFHFSFEEATDHYNQWISDPDYGPNPRLHNLDAESPLYLPQLRPYPALPFRITRLL